MPRWCAHTGCNKSSGYNFTGLSGLYCKTHKKMGMVDVIHKKCRFQGCITRPGYTWPGEKTPLLCAAHRLQGMLCATRCTRPTCGKWPTYKHPGCKRGTPRYCSGHRPRGTITVNVNTSRRSGSLKRARPMKTPRCKKRARASARVQAPPMTTAMTLLLLQRGVPRLGAAPRNAPQPKLRRLLPQNAEQPLRPGLEKAEAQRQN